ncbi:unnamed protein product [Acanthoscelides obtectus]|uniref:Uncharacterized protein n=1 Tax=Acanthoscelides obtectus TaxID=200917 RepID=A0A9P0Q3B8_ACAOB|nr:unnamed protein product [Acanthoscelides obtectus]CAK1689125.1 hypothetical protein AOBTE_LOCUS37021 [Acanthoscelides obtectus]
MEESINLVYEDHLTKIGDDQTQIHHDDMQIDDDQIINNIIPDILEEGSVNEPQLGSASEAEDSKSKKRKFNSGAQYHSIDPLQHKPFSGPRPEKMVSSKQSKVIDINNKKAEMYGLKIEVLKTISKTELEHLKGAKLENDIKELIEQKEIVNLKMKNIELKKYVSLS